MKTTSSLALFIATAVMAASALAQTAATAPASTQAAAVSSSAEHQLSGVAAYYSSRLNGRKTASGQRFDNSALTAAHNTLPFGTRIKITNTKNNRSVVVRVNDRGPTTPGRAFDLSRAAASRLGYIRSGLTDVKAEIVTPASAKPAKKSK